MRILVFGDSITQGFWDSQGGWVARLRRHYDLQFLKNKNEDHITVFNLGISGGSSDQLIKRLGSEIDTRSLDWPEEEILIIFATGINDSRIRNGEPYSTPKEFGENMKQAIEIATAKSDKIMIVGLTPVVEERTTPVSWSPTSYKNKRILGFDDVLRRLADENKIPYVAAFDVLQEAQKDSEHMTDGLHPDDNGHELLYKLVLPEIEKCIER